MKTSKLRRSMALFLTGLMILSFSLPGQAISANAASKKYIKSLTVPSKVSVKKGKKKTVKVKISTVNKASKKVTVKVKNKNVVKVTYSSKKNTITISGKKKGKTTITVTTKAKNKKGKKLTKKISVTVTDASKSSEDPKEEVTASPQPATTQQPTNSSSSGGNASSGGSGSKPNQPTAEKKVTKINITPASVRQMKGTTAILTATVEPEDAIDKKIEWSTNDDSVVKVSEGNLTLCGAGTAKVTAKNPASGVTATCEVTSLDSVTVKTQEELQSALNNSTVGEITLNPASDSQITIPEGTHNDVALIVSGAADATVENSGRFASVSVISGVYEEKATNTISINGAAKVKVAEGATADVLVNVPQEAAEKKVSIENNGTISGLKIASAATVNLTGAATTKVPVGISDKDAKLISNQNLDVSLTAPAKLVFTGDVDDTTITIDKEESMPAIEGVGTFEVINSTTKETTPVVATPSEELGTVTIQGKIVDAYDFEKPLAKVSVELLSQDGSQTIQSVTSDETGKYVFEDIKSGNYNLLMKKEGYKDAKQLIAASARFGLTYENETMQMLASDVEDNSEGEITGNVTDAADKSTISGLTVELRTGKGNVLGTAVKTTTTDTQGQYTFENLEAEHYTIRFVDQRENVDTRYISKFENVCVKHDTTVNGNASLSKPVSTIDGKGGNAIRFVLSWGSESDGEDVPEDMDSHIFGPSLSGSGMHEVFYDSKKYGVGEVYTMLDVDEIHYNGPETTTIQKLLDGTYYYYVYRYSDYGTLQASKAKVDIYSGDQLLTTYHIPDNGGTDARYWKVCSYDAKTDQFQSYNTIERKLSVPGLDLEEGEVDSCNCEHGMQSGIKTITSSLEDALVSQEISTEDQYIMLTGTKKWDEIKDTLSYQCLEGYTAEYKDATPEEIADAANSNYRGIVSVKRGSETVGEYLLYYTEVISVTVSGAGLAKSYFSDRGKGERYLYLYYTNDTDITSFTYTCSDPDYKLEWKNNGEDLYLVNKNNEEDIEQIMLYKYSGYYLSNISGVDTFYEDDTSINIITTDGKIPENIQFTCAEGYTAELGTNSEQQKVLNIKDSDNQTVVSKVIFSYTQSEWEDE